MKNKMLEKSDPLATRLLQLRKHFGKSQKEMASWVGITQLAWFNYESGKSVPNGKVLATMCEYGININWVLADQQDMLSYLNFAPTEQVKESESSLLTGAIEHVETWLDTNNKSISAHKKAELLNHIYQDSLETGTYKINNSKVNNLLKIVVE